MLTTQRTHALSHAITWRACDLRANLVVGAVRGRASLFILMAEAEIIATTKRLLSAVGAGDYSTYESLSSADITCIEPETQGNIVTGLPFHKYYFDLAKSSPKTNAPPTQNSISSPHVRMLGSDHALISYVRVIQNGDKIATANETRLWKREGGVWKNIHFHRSKL